MPEQATTPKQAKPPKSRSPNYPGIDLGAALARAEQLYTAQRDHPGPVDVILSHWGYAHNSGGGLVAVAALKKFGLLMEEGKGKERTGRLTDLALSIIQDQRPNSPEKAALIKQAALQPAIHREVWERYQGNLPEDPHLLYYLQRERGFTEHGAKGFLTQFRKTIAFAQLAPSDTLGATDETSQGGNGPSNQAGKPGMTPAGSQVKDPPGQKSYRIPVDANEDWVLTFSGSATPEKWDTFVTILEAMKGPILSSKDKDEEE